MRSITHEYRDPPLRNVRPGPRRPMAWHGCTASQARRLAQAGFEVRSIQAAPHADQDQYSDGYAAHEVAA